VNRAPCLENRSFSPAQVSANAEAAPVPIAGVFCSLTVMAAAAPDDGTDYRRLHHWVKMEPVGDGPSRAPDARATRLAEPCEAVRAYTVLGPPKQSDHRREPS
jgi:hypothetical protein